MSEAKKDVQQAMQPKVNTLKGKLPSGEKIDLEEHQVATNGDCGFIGLGFDRGQVADQLLKLSDDTESREFLAEEILSALMLEEFVTLDKKWSELAAESREQQKTLDDLIRKIKSDAKSGGKINALDVEGLTKWLYQTKPEGEELKALLELRGRLARAEKTLRDYITTPDMFRDYLRDMKVEREKKRQWLGYKSALLYAKLTHMTLYIWCKVDKNAQKLRLVDYHDAGNLPNSLIHLLHTDGFTHYNLLSSPASSIHNSVFSNDNSTPFIQYIENVIDPRADSKEKSNQSYNQSYVEELNKVLKNASLFDKQKQIAAEGLQAFETRLLQNKDFLFLTNFHQKAFFEDGSPFCQEVSDIIKIAEIILEFEKNHTIYKKFDTPKEESDKKLAWEKCHYEIFCIKYFCEKIVAKNLPDDEELKKFIGAFIRQHTKTEKDGQRKAGRALRFLLTELTNVYSRVRTKRDSKQMDANRIRALVYDYINVFFYSYTKESRDHLLSLLYDSNLFDEQTSMGGREIEGFKPTPPERGFLAKFHQASSFNHLKQDSFCRRVREIVLQFEREHMDHERPTDIYAGSRWDKRHYELFCIKYFCVQSAKLPDHRELKEFIDEFIIKTEQSIWMRDYNSLVTKLSELCAKYRKGTNSDFLKKSVIVHDEGKKGRQIVLLNTKVDELEAKIADHDRAIEKVEAEKLQQIEKEALNQQRIRLEQETRFRKGVEIFIKTFKTPQGSVFLNENPVVKKDMKELKNLIKVTEDPKMTPLKRYT